jgi:excisionase family DNA binding protein
MMSMTEEPVVLTSAEIDRAVASTRASAAVDANGHHTASVPQAAEGLRLASDVLARLAAGQIVTLIPEHAELTVGQAADVLLVSPPFVSRLIDVGELPSRTHGTRQLVRYDDLMAYKLRTDAEAREAMRELTRESEALGLYK